MCPIASQMNLRLEANAKSRTFLAWKTQVLVSVDLSAWFALASLQESRQRQVVPRFWPLQCLAFVPRRGLRSDSVTPRYADDMVRWDRDTNQIVAEFQRKLTLPKVLLCVASPLHHCTPLSEETTERFRRCSFRLFRRTHNQFFLAWSRRC